MSDENEITESEITEDDNTKVNKSEEDELFNSSKKISNSDNFSWDELDD